MTALEYVTDGQRHLVCRPYSKENLHRMAEELGIPRCWFHRDHYDIPTSRRAGWPSSPSAAARSALGSCY